MIARLLISSSIDKIREEIKEININHPDMLYFKAGEKLGIGEARKIKDHFSLKPYSAKGRTVIIEDASVMTIEAQNALLKTLEEPPEEAILILGAPSDSNLLPTILSRCQIIRITNNELRITNYADIEKLLNASIEDRFEYIEKLKDKKEFLHYLVYIFREAMVNHNSPIHNTIVEHIGSTSDIKNFLKELLQAEQWAKQNVNIRGILEYLMLKMPVN